MAVCAMMTALTVVLMILGAVLELGMYACYLRKRGRPWTAASGISLG
jgi:hypothetical protein